MTTTEFMDLLERAAPQDASFVCSLGRTSDEAFGHFPTQTLFLDSMGDIVPLACGIALGLPGHPVVALDTDGSQLMGITCLAVVGALRNRLSNLLVIILDNHLYESAGNLPSRECEVDWPLLGQSFGVPITLVTSEEELTMAFGKAFSTLTYVVVQVNNFDAVPRARKTMDGIESRYVFIRHLERLTGGVLLRPSVKS